MRALPLPAASQSLAIVRCGLALLLFIHGSSRIWKGDVAGFGEFLDGSGLPLGLGIAWFVSVFETICAPLMAFGRWLVTPIAMVFIAIYACGIWLVHFKEGWFVVGGGRNGMEYSVLIILCLAAIAWAHKGEILKRRDS